MTGKLWDKAIKCYYLNEAELAKVEEMSALGMSLRQVAAVLGIAESALRKAKNYDDEVALAWERGRALGLMKAAMVVTERIQQKDIEAAKLYLKAKGWDESNKDNATAKTDDVEVTKDNAAELYQIARQQVLELEAKTGVTNEPGDA